MENINKGQTNFNVSLPKAVSEATKTDLTPIEMRVYSEIISKNHTKNHDQLVYNIPYDLVCEKRRKSRNLQDLSKLSERTFIFKSQFMEKYFGKNANYIITPIPKIIFSEDSDFIEVHLEPTFKKILTLIDKSLDEVDSKGIPYVKGRAEDLRNFKLWFTHKFYWLLRAEQDKTQITKKNFFDITIIDLKEKLSCEGLYKDLKSLKRVLTTAKGEVEGTFVELEDFSPLKKGGVATNKRGVPTIGFRFTFKHSIREISEKVQRKEKFRWEDDLKQLKVSEADIEHLRVSVVHEKEAVSKNGITFIFTSDYIEQCIEIARKDIYKRNVLKDGKPFIHNFAKWIIRGILEGWWLEKYEERQQEETKKIKIQQTQKTVQSLGRPFALENRQTILYTYDEIEQLHKHSKWSKYDIKHYMAGFVKVIPLKQYAPKKDADLFKGLGMNIQEL